MASHPSKSKSQTPCCYLICPTFKPYIIWPPLSLSCCSPAPFLCFSHPTLLVHLEHPAKPTSEPLHGLLSPPLGILFPYLSSWASPSLLSGLLKYFKSLSYLDLPWPTYLKLNLLISCLLTFIFLFILTCIST